MFFFLCVFCVIVVLYSVCGVIMFCCMKFCIEYDYYCCIVCVIEVILVDFVVLYIVQSLVVVVYLFLFYFYCIYWVFIGEGVFEIVQCMWLVQVVYWLSGVEDFVIDVVFNVGYGSLQVFVCVFCEFIGVSLCVFQIWQQVLNVCSIEIVDLLFIELIEQLFLYVFCLCYDGFVVIICQMFVMLWQLFGIELELVDVFDCIGVCYGDLEMFGLFEYFVGVIFDMFCVMIGELQLMCIEGGFYVCYWLIGFYVLIVFIMQVFYGGCFLSYGFELDDWLVFELYCSFGWYYLLCVCVIDLMIFICKE